MKSTSPPRDHRARERMRPIPAPELDEVVTAVAKASPVYPDLARTGLRWGEARAMLVRDCSEVPMPVLSVIRNQPEGEPVAYTPKSGKGRRVPLPDALLPVIRRFAEGKSPDDMLFTRPGGGQLHRSMFVRQTNWGTVGRSRTLHDLRHTAACEWILQGVPLTTVQAWLGHSSIEITSRYLHHLGDFADRSALQLLNARAASAPEQTCKEAARHQRLPAECDNHPRSRPWDQPVVHTQEPPKAGVIPG